MAEITRTRRIDVTPEAVWAVLGDFGAISAWASNVDHSSLLRCEPVDRPANGGDDHLGLIRRVQVGRMTLLERVVTWSTDHDLAYEIEGLPKAVRSVRNAWHLEGDGAGTRVALTSTVDCGPRPPRRLIARILTRRLACDSDTMLTGLADHLERHHG